VDTFVLFVTDPLCPSSKQTKKDKVAALKKHAHDFMGQPRTSDNTGLSYLVSRLCREGPLTQRL
jgi:hypothetical protein